MTLTALQLDDPIAALASAPGPAAVGILRISGPGVRNVLGQFFCPDNPTAFAQTRCAIRHVGEIRLTAFSAALPVSVYFWPTVRSYTGEPMAEVHTIGSPPLLEAVLDEIYANGVRPARPGEFTLRAFLAGRIDLVQAEAVLGVVDAHDHRELEQALSQLAGGLSTRLTAVRNDLMDLLADIEAGLDFVEDDIEFVSKAEVLRRLFAANKTLEQLLDQADDRMQSTGRQRVVLAGLPNAGKSTLFNTLVGREAALVSHQSGTTRDYLSAPLDVDGTTIELIDTAGWDLPSNQIDEQAQSLRNEQLQDAELILWCSAANFDRVTQERDARSRAELLQQPIPVLTIITKGDLKPTDETSPPLVVSAVTGTGLVHLVQRIAASLSSADRGTREFVGTTAARCRESLRSTKTSLQEAHETTEFGGGEELVAIAVRDALGHIGPILGEVYTDDILDRVFSRFCIGK